MKFLMKKWHKAAIFVEQFPESHVDTVYFPCQRVEAGEVKLGPAQVAKPDIRTKPQTTV